MGVLRPGAGLGHDTASFLQDNSAGNSIMVTILVMNKFLIDNAKTSLQTSVVICILSETEFSYSAGRSGKEKIEW